MKTTVVLRIGLYFGLLTLAQCQSGTGGGAGADGAAPVAGEIGSGAVDSPIKLADLQEVAEAFAWNPVGGPEGEEPPGGQPAGVEVPDIACEWEDPVSRYLICRAACHYAVGTIRNVERVQNGYVLAVPAGYVALDTRHAEFSLDEDLTRTPPFADGDFVLPGLSSGVVDLQELPSGYADVYSNTDPQQYLYTAWESRVVVDDEAKLAAAARVVLALRPSANLLEPRRWDVVLSFPVDANGNVDMSDFDGEMRSLIKDGDEISVPVGPVSVGELAEFFRWTTSHNYGVQCEPRQGEPELDTLPK